jgi:hypothetical protein
MLPTKESCQARRLDTLYRVGWGFQLVALGVCETRTDRANETAEWHPG